jgi:hypothetical protein
MKLQQKKKTLESSNMLTTEWRVKLAFMTAYSYIISTFDDGGMVWDQTVA